MHHTPNRQGKIKKLFPALLTALLFTMGAFAQKPVTVTGIAQSESGEKLDAATVSLKSTKLNFAAVVASDERGLFTFNNVPAGGPYVLTISHVGFQTRVMENYHFKEGDKISLAIKLKDSTLIGNEVVVIGYGTQKKSNVTGSVSTMKGSEVTQSPSTHLTNSFAGRLPGVVAVERSGEPGSEGAQLFIRGRSTLGDNSPLIVVDGVPSMLGGLDKIDPNDVESISVLKDASASIYGSRAANGVILVTTKRGKAGKPAINYTFNQGFVSPTRMPNMADAPLYAQLVNEILKYSGGQPKFTEADIEKFRDGSSPWTHPNTNWIDEVIKPVSLQTQQNLSLRGGGDKVRYYVSLGTEYEDAVYRKSATNYKQQNLRMNLDADVNQYIHLNFDVQGRHGTKNYPPTSAASIFRFTLRGRPTETAVYPNGLPGPDIEGGNNPVVTTTNEIGYNKHDISLINTLFGFNVKIPGIQGLSIDGNFSYSKEHIFKKNFIKPWTLYTFNGFDAQGDPKLASAARGVADPKLTETYETAQQLLMNGKINYARSFGDHYVAAFVGYEQNEEKGNNFSGSRRYFISPAVDELFAGGQNERTIDGSGYEEARRNYFGRASYHLRGTYLVDFNWRYDGSQNFPKDRRYGFFPGVSAGWVISNENFLKTVAPIDYLKLRASYGQMGNDKVAKFQYLSNYAFGGGAIFGSGLEMNQSIYPNLVPNPYITWEVANTFNVGIETRLFRSWSLEVDYFNTTRSNILISRAASVPEYAGLALPDENLGKVRNQGFDARLNWKKVVRNFGFDITGTASYSTNEILFWDEPANIPDHQRRTGTGIGSDLYYKAIGVFKTTEEVNAYPHWSGARAGDVIFEDVNGDKIIDAKDRIRIDRSEIPRWIYGLTLGVQFKQIDMMMLWQGAADAAQYVRTESGLIGNFPLEYVKDRWTESNPNASQPRVFDNREYWITQRNSYWLYNTNYLRLKTLQLGYTFRQQLLQKIGLSNLRVYASGYNLLTFDKVKIFDPELPDGTGQFYPQVQVFNAGLNLTF